MKVGDLVQLKYDRSYDHIVWRIIELNPDTLPAPLAKCKAVWFGKSKPHACFIGTGHALRFNTTALCPVSALKVLAMEGE